MNKKMRSATFIVVIAILVTYMVTSCKPHVQTSGSDADNSVLVALDSRREVVKTFHFIEYINRNDLKGACEFADLTLKSNLIILAPDGTKSLPEGEAKKNKALYERIDQYFKTGQCLPNQSSGHP